MMKTNTVALDFSAISLSFLCFAHCLALPLLSALLPVAGVLAEAEWIHKGLVLLAVPVTTFAIVSSFSTKGSSLFTLGAVCGLALLLVAAFVEPLHDMEVMLTTLGALILAASHTWRWRVLSQRQLRELNS